MPKLMADVVRQSPPAALLGVLLWRQASSIVTPLGDEMYYRYQQYLIDDATTTLAALLQSSSNDEGATWRPVSLPE
jgi:hypothetical protein